MVSIWRGGTGIRQLQGYSYYKEHGKNSVVIFQKRGGGDRKQKG